MTTRAISIPVPEPKAAQKASGIDASLAHCPYFDWLRASLAITVALKHDHVVQWANAGNFSVQVFFALSGWLIGRILLRLPRGDLARFYFNRAARIWVPYYLALALFLCASLLHDRVSWKWAEIVAYMSTMTYNLFGAQQLVAHGAEMPLQGTGNGFWSVNAEEQFYLAAPLLLVVAGAWGRSVILWVALAGLALLTNTYAAIMLGVLAAVVSHRFGDLQQFPPVRLALAVVAAAAALWLADPATYSVAAPVCGIAIVLLLAVPGAQHRFGDVAAGMSYPLYLNAWIGVFVAHAVLRPFGLRDSHAAQAMALALNVALSIALYLWVDRRLPALRKRLFTDGRAKAAMVTAFSMVATGITLGVVLR